MPFPFGDGIFLLDLWTVPLNHKFIEPRGVYSKNKVQPGASFV